MCIQGASEEKNICGTASVYVYVYEYVCSSVAVSHGGSTSMQLVYPYG